MAEYSYKANGNSKTTNFETRRHGDRREIIELGWTLLCALIVSVFPISDWYWYFSACRSPDASWITEERWILLSNEERRGYPPLCPDFVVELRSDSDRLAELQEKLREYVENGIQLGWLIDPLMVTSRMNGLLLVGILHALGFTPTL